MLFAAFVLIAVDGEHDGLQKRVDFSHGDKSAEMGNVPRLRLEQEQKIAVFLCLFIVGEEAFLQFGSLVEMTGNFVLLFAWSALANIKFVLPCVPLPMPCGSE